MQGALLNRPGEFRKLMFALVRQVHRDEIVHPALIAVLVFEVRVQVTVLLLHLFRQREGPGA